MWQEEQDRCCRQMKGHKKAKTVLTNPDPQQSLNPTIYGRKIWKFAYYVNKPPDNKQIETHIVKGCILYQV